MATQYPIRRDRARVAAQLRAAAKRPLVVGFSVGFMPNYVGLRGWARLLFHEVRWEWTRLLRRLDVKGAR